MASTGYDVYLCCREGTGTAAAVAIAAGLARRGFRVFVGACASGDAPDDGRLTLIEEAPDFVLLLTEGALDTRTAESDRMRAELRHALAHERTVVPVELVGEAGRWVASLPPEFASLARRHRIAFDPSRIRPSSLLLASTLVSAAEVEDRIVVRQVRRAFAAAVLAVIVMVGIKEGPAFVDQWMQSRRRPPIPPFALYWAGYGQRLTSGQWTEFAVADGTPVSNGDQLRFVFSPSADGFAYVVGRQLNGEVAILFPSQMIRGAARVRAGQVYEMPVGQEWLTLDDRTAPAVIYLLAGYDPLENVEELLEEAEAGATAASRLDLLDSTVAGLVDGRHTPIEPHVRARNGQEIDRGLAIRPGPATSSATLTSGAVVHHPMTAEAGLLSASVEIRLRYEPTR